MSDDRSQLWPMAPGRLWLDDRGPQRGAGEVPIVLLHSLLVTGWDFRQLVAPWHESGARRVLIPDLFGCGNSDRPPPADTAGYGFAWHAELLARLLDRVDIESGEFDLVGHGYGGTIAIALAHRLARAEAGHRVRLRRLILVAPHVLPVEAPIALPGPLPTLRRSWRWLGFSPLVLRTVFRRADLRRFLRRCLADPALLEREPLDHDVDVYWDRLCRDGGLEAVEAMLRQIDALHDGAPAGSRARLYDMIRSRNEPTMLVWGDRDEIVPPAQGDRVATLLPDAQLRVLEACGHAPQREHPKSLFRAIESFDRRMR
ncbi:alpha/beta hydrolase [Pseudenhygromyxa sp. WMMC2535]|uniref:alpha/beta fold hydrolase n=1 Tax=Pseudenhygromyxa sp. WMMC2535 TaxID=2712867 RepID=UPI001557FB53|nr:alpha/beta hydrolase [Pseudenhygromyxa sp. WMMC2535]NVB40118.1 alpha/beta hydrolase [Pseudenhygromyxa sp. WMMC2535]